MLRDALAGHEASTSLVIADVMRTRLSGLDPLPRKVVANLPYGVATPAILKTIDEMPEAELWCVMVQREIAGRLAAKPGTKALRNPLRAGPARLRGRGRAADLPQRVPAGAERRLRARADAPHRRPRRPTSWPRWCARRSRTGARRLRGRWRRPAGRPASGRPCATALEEMGHPADARAETLTPQEFAQLERELERPG